MVVTIHPQPDAQKPNNIGIPGGNTGTDPDKNKISGKYQGKALTAPAKALLPSGISKNIGSDDLASTTIDGKQLVLQIPNIISGETTAIGGNVTFGGRSYQRFYASGLNYKNSKFGYITEGGTDYIFSHGVPTANMPTSGSARYTGAAFINKGGQVGTGVSDVSADFAAKTITVDITPASKSPFTAISFKGLIDGNKFNSVDNSAVDSHGYFYGDNASEVGGTVTDTRNNAFGSFGARRAN